MKGISDVSARAAYIKSAKGGRVRSAKKTKNSSYLELLTLNAERSRLAQEKANLLKICFTAEAKMERIQKRLEEIGAKMLSISQRIHEEEEAEKMESPQPEEKLPKKKWQAVAADY